MKDTYLQDYVAVVIGLDVVEADDAGNVQSTVDGTRMLLNSVQRTDGILRERRVEDVLDVFQRRVCEGKKNERSLPR